MTKITTDRHAVIFVDAGRTQITMTPAEFVAFNERQKTFTDPIADALRAGDLSAMSAAQSAMRINEAAITRARELGGEFAARRRALGLDRDHTMPVTSAPQIGNPNSNPARRAHRVS